MALDFYKALKAIALRDVLQERSDYYIRHINRWYSKTFHTPLIQVEALALEHVLQHFYESKYEDLDEEGREKERQALVESPEDAKNRAMSEEFESYSAMLFEKESGLLADRLFAAKKKKLELNAAAEERANKPIVEPVRSLPESTLDGLPNLGPETLQPNISMTFLSAAEMEERLEGPTIDEGPDDHSNLKMTPTEPK